MLELAAVRINQRLSFLFLFIDGKYLFVLYEYLFYFLYRPKIISFLYLWLTIRFQSFIKHSNNSCIDLLSSTFHFTIFFPYKLQTFYCAIFYSHFFPCLSVYSSTFTIEMNICNFHPKRMENV